MRKVLRKIGSICLVTMMAFAFLAPLLETTHAAAQYEIVFKGGLHGTVDNQKSVSYRVNANDMFPNEPSVQVEDGYIFTGWSKPLPQVGSKVDRKMVFVAKYDVVVDGISYIVRYVDENNAPVATAKTMMAEKGTTIVERAKVVENYEYLEASKEIVLSEKQKEIIFVYRDTRQKEQIRYEEEQVNVAGDAAQGGTQGGNQEGNTTNPGVNEEEVNQPDQPKGEGNEAVDDKDTPLAEGEVTEYLPMIAVGVGGVVLVGLVAYLVWKKRKEKEVENN